MKNYSSVLVQLLTGLAIFANILFALWILYNGINEGFRGTTIERISYITLMLLLTINAILLFRKRNN